MTCKQNKKKKKIHKLHDSIFTIVEEMYDYCLNNKTKSGYINRTFETKDSKHICTIKIDFDIKDNNGGY